MKKCFFILSFSALFCECDSAADHHPSVQYEEKKTSLADMEKDSPLKFLKITGDMHGNLLNQTVVSGEVTNGATLTAYHNIQVQMTFRDQEGNVIEKQKQLIDDDVKPNSSTEFKIKTSHIKDANSVSLNIVDATSEK